FWHSAVAAASIDKNIPLFVATGESKIWVDKLYSEKKIIKAVKRVVGVIAVSTKNKIETLELNLAEESQITVIPNSVDTSKFYPMEKSEVRQRLGFNKDDFIVVFVGSFNERKGVLRLSKALRDIPN